MTAEYKKTLSDELKDWKFWLVCFVAFWTAKLIGILGLFLVFGIWALVKYFWKQFNSASISDCDVAQNISTVVKPINVAETPPIDAQPTINNQSSVNALPAITIESSQQSMQEIEDQLYEQIAQEIETNTVDKGTWTKAYAQCGGDDKLTRVAYIKTRFEKLLAVENARLEACQREQDREALQRKQEEIMRIGTAQFEQENADALRSLQVSVEWFDFKSHCSRGSIDEVKDAVYKTPLLLYIANSNDGMTALHLAVNEKQQEVARFLAERGARVGARNSGGETPIDIAKRKGQTELAAFLQQFSVGSNG